MTTPVLLAFMNDVCGNTTYRQVQGPHRQANAHGQREHDGGIQQAAEEVALCSLGGRRGHCRLPVPVKEITASGTEHSIHGEIHVRYRKSFWEN